MHQEKLVILLSFVDLKASTIFCAIQKLNNFFFFLIGIRKTLNLSTDADKSNNTTFLCQGRAVGVPLKCY